MGRWIITHEGRPEGVTFYIMKGDDPWDAIERVKVLEEDRDPPITRDTWKENWIGAFGGDIDAWSETDGDHFMLAPISPSTPAVKYGPWREAE